MVVLPSSPVWYQSRGTDTSHNSILAFGSRNLVFLLDLAQKRAEIYGILSGHTDKVTTCSFCPLNDQDQLLRISSGADDCIVKVWDVRQKLMLHEHNAHGSNKIISVHWSPVNPYLILSGDEKGFVVCWNLDKGSTDRFYPDGSSQMHLGCLTCSPHDENIVAVGYKSGAVSLMDIKRNGTVIKKFRGHTNEVHSIIWSPNKDESLVFTNKQQKDEEGDVTNGGYEGVIATGSKDKTIKLWSISEGKCRRTLRIPNTVKKGRKVNEDVARLYASIYWPQNSTSRFVSSGYNGDLVVWDLSPGAENLFEVLASQTHDAGHQRIVFNITHGTNLTNTIVSTSMDRQLFHWTIPAESPSNSSGPDWVLPTLGGFVYSVSVSPKDPSVVAVGVGDGMIRVWKTRSTRSAYDISTLWQGIKEKVMALAWHPTKEGCLAFATEDGKVGIYDTLSLRPPVVAETYHLKPVYALSWGPRCFPKPVNEEESKSSAISTKSKNLHLFSCGGDGIILQHDPSNMSKDAINIEQIISSSNPGHSSGKHSEVSWKQDGSLLGIGNDNGTINIYLSPNLTHVLEIKSHSKIVNCVTWKPQDEEHNNDDIEIVTGSNNSIIHIHDLKKIFVENQYTLGNDLDKPITVSKSHRSLVGHLSRITGISYNPRNTSQIVSSSYDSTAQVWDTKTEKPLYNFRGHHGRLMCVAWTSVIEDENSAKSSGMIYTGADDYTVHGWYAEDQQHTEPVKVLPDFGFGPKNKFQNKKKGRNKKSSQNSNSAQPTSNQNVDKTTNGTVTEEAPNDRASPDIDLLLEKKKAELLATINCDLPVKETSTYSVEKTKEKSFAGSPSYSPATPSKPSPQSTSSKLESTTPIKPGSAPEDDLFGRRRKRIKNMFPQSVTMDNRKKSDQHQDCIKIVEWNTRDRSNLTENDLSFVPGSVENINLGFYTDRRAAFRMMKNESEKLEADDFMEANYNIKLWTGDIVGTIEDAREKSQLNDQLVAMSPIAGQAFWRKTAHAFAQQLIAEDHHLHAVQYLLACDKVHEAIQVLLDSRHYREAVALAKARLCDDDPVLIRTIKAWARKLKIGGSVELAAKCFAAIGDFHEASASLAQRATSGASIITDSDISSLWAAASVAKAAGNAEDASEYANRALHTVCLRTWNWFENDEFLSSFHNLLAYRFVSVVHEILTTRLIRKAGLKELQTTKRSNWNAPDFYSKADPRPCSFHDILFIARCEHAGQSDSDGFDEIIMKDLDAESIVRIHLEAKQHQLDSSSESRILLQVAFLLAAAICVRLPNIRNYQIDSSNNIAEKDWIYHLANSVILLSKSKTMDFKMSKEILTVVCEVISWITTFNFNEESTLSVDSNQGYTKFNISETLFSKMQIADKDDAESEKDLGNTHLTNGDHSKLPLPSDEVLKNGVRFLLNENMVANNDLSSFLEPYLNDGDPSIV